MYSESRLTTLISEVQDYNKDLDLANERIAKLETGFAALAKAHVVLVDCVKELRSSLPAHVNHS